MKENRKMKAGKTHVTRIGQGGEWIVAVAINDKDLEELGYTFNLYFTARIPPDSKIKSDPNVFSGKMEELGWKRKKGSLFGKSGIVFRELKMSLEEIKSFILTMERAKRLKKEIGDKELFYFLSKNGNGGSGIFLSKDFTTKNCLEITSNLNDFSTRIMREHSIYREEVVCL